MGRMVQLNPLEIAFSPELPQALSLTISGMIGLFVGSFLNVVIVRVPFGQSIVRPGSHCPQCQKAVRWFDNIPVLSFCLLRGRCRNCRASIPARYLLVELLTGLLFLAATVVHGWNPDLILRVWVLVSILVAVTFIDLEHLIIPDGLSLGGLAYGLLTSFLFSSPGWVDSTLGAAAGFLFFYLLAQAYRAYSKQDGLGGGDVKLLAMIGAFLGCQGVWATVLVSSVGGSVIGLGFALITRKREIMKMALPFGPFLVLGALFYVFFGRSLWLPYMTPT